LVAVALPDLVAGLLDTEGLVAVLAFSALAAPAFTLGLLVDLAAVTGLDGATDFVAARVGFLSSAVAAVGMMQSPLVGGTTNQRARGLPQRQNAAPKGGVGIG
jgi:hypothetical protein